MWLAKKECREDNKSCHGEEGKKRGEEKRGDKERAACHCGN